MKQKMTAHDKDLLIEFFMYRLSWKDRQELMQELPGVYNRYHGKVMVEVYQRRN